MISKNALARTFPNRKGFWRRLPAFLAAASCVGLVFGCVSVDLLPDAADPLQEYTLEGKGRQKVLVLPVEGLITDRPDEGLIRRKPGLVQEVVSHLRKAEKDEDVRAVLLKVNSPGGTVTASDIVYRELLDFQRKTGASIVAVMMSLAASGGYYVCLAADRIVAHPTSVTGSVGVVFASPRAHALMDKIGVEVKVTKSGRNKDMGSPFRESTKEEDAIFQSVIGEMGDRFLRLAAERRGLSEEAIARVATARIFTAEEALRLKLVDAVGYMPDALEEARRLAGLPEDSRVIVYRRTEYPDDSWYNSATMKRGGNTPALMDFGWSRWISRPQTGFYYLWPPALSGFEG